MQYKVLVVEDIPAQQELISRYLTIKGYRSIFADNGEDAVIKAKRYKPNIIILDLYLPDVDGIKVCEVLKSDKITSKIPIIMVTARKSTADIINGLQVGADDYVIKPYNYQELLARIEAIIRRSENNGSTNQIIEKDGLRILYTERKILIEDKPLQNITRKEFELLTLLVKKSPSILSAEYLIDAIWGDKAVRNYHTLDTHVYNLRKKMGKKWGDKIMSVYGSGYKYE